MKNLTLTFATLLIGVVSYAQAPELLNYQGIARDASGDALSGQLVSIRFTIHETTSTGTTVYQETHSTTTGSTGMVNLTIGSGSVVSGTFSSIDWASHPHYLEVELDPNGGSSYTSVGTQQLLSVPYALHAGSTDFITDNTLAGTGMVGDSLRIAQQGASTGDVLKWNGDTWLPGGDENAQNTLDEAYDEGVNPGDGRIIEADAGPVRINATNNTALYIEPEENSVGIEIKNVIGDGMGVDINVPAPDAVGVNVDVTGTGTGVDVTLDDDGTGLNILHTGDGQGIYVDHSAEGEGIAVDHSGDSDGILVNHSGDADGVHIDQSAGGDGLEIVKDGTNKGIRVTSSSNSVPGDDREGLYVKKDSTATGIAAQIISKNPTDNTVTHRSLNEGMGFGAQGQIGEDKTGLNTPVSSGVFGLSTLNIRRNGVAGVAQRGNGVYGLTHSTTGFDTLTNPLWINAGVFGTAEEGGALTGGSGYIGVVGHTKGEGQGVVGFGKKDGSGVIGISGQGETPTAVTKSIAGVHGMAFDFPTLTTQLDSFPITDATANKGRVGVLGQAKTGAAVWGESLEKAGVVGTVGDRMTKASLSDTATFGVYGRNSLTDGIAGYFKATGVSSQPAVLIESNSLKAGLKVSHANDGYGLHMHYKDRFTGFDTTAMYVENDGDGMGFHLYQSSTAANTYGARIDNESEGVGVFAMNFNPVNDQPVMELMHAGKGSGAVIRTLPAGASSGTEDPPAVLIESNLNGKGLMIDMNAMDASKGFSGAFIQQGGKGIGAQVKMDNPASTSAGFIVESITGAGPGTVINMNDPDMGANSNMEPALKVLHEGLGNAGTFTIDEASNTVPALIADHKSMGIAGQFLSAGGTEPAVDIATGSARALNIVSTSASGSTSIPVAKITSGTKGHLLHLQSTYSTDPTLAAPLNVEGLAGKCATFTNTGVASVSPAVSIVSASAGGAAISATGAKAGEFIGSVDVVGTLTALAFSANAKLFRIDHPLDPENKILQHSCVESDDMMNIYNGNVMLDANGRAVVEMANWFEALNEEYRYQLTCIGGYAPVYIAEKVDNGKFVIAGGSPGLEVSWQITGIRHDASAEYRRVQVELDKSPEMKGTYLDPAAFESD